MSTETTILMGVATHSRLSTVGDHETEIEASTMTTKPLKRLPHRFDAAALVDVMKQIGLPLPDGAKLHASDGKRLAPVGVRFSEAAIDAALDKTELAAKDRIAVKIAISNNGLFGR